MYKILESKISKCDSSTFSCELIRSDTVPGSSSLPTSPSNSRTARGELARERISEALDVGKAYVCTDTSQLASTMEKIFTASVAASE